MNANEFTRLKSIIKSSYRAQWLDQPDIEQRFFNFCNQYDYETCKNAVMALIEYGNDDLPVTMQTIELRIERESRKQKKPKVQPKEECQYCHNTGYILRTFPTGRDYFRACSCPIGREKYPWWFESQADYDARWEKEIQKGRTKPNYFPPPPPEIRNQFKYDEKASEVYMQKLDEANGAKIPRPERGVMNGQA